MLNLNEQTLAAYQDKVRAQVKEMKAKMTMLEAEAEKSSAGDLKSRFKDIEMRLDRFSNSAEDSWDKIRLGIDKSMSELRNALNKATKHINN
jgi:ElaB/YqjD/DUF883 family membrane-anchored ribosome-binding protein